MTDIIENTFKYTTAIKKIRAMKARKKVIQGSTSAGKTHGIVPILIHYAAKYPRQKITMVAETIPAVKDGCVDIFHQVMTETNRWRQSGWKGSPMEYSFQNGSRIQFKSFDTAGKAKASGKRDVLFINEANHVPYQIADALMIRSKQTYLDYNPDNEFWAHTEVLTEPNSEFLTLTYLDNEAIPPETLEDMLIKRDKAFKDPYLPVDKIFDDSNIISPYWANWWRVYGLGMTGKLEGVIFNNWDKIAVVPETARLLGYGLDFGYTNDPTALIALYYWNNSIVLHELIYETKMLNSDIKQRMVDLGIKYEMIWADSAEPKSIAEIQSMGTHQRGFNVMGVKKGADSIKFGIDIMQEQNFLITETSLNLIKEFRHYAWAKDKLGMQLNKPIDDYNHGIDAVRYFAMMELSSMRGNYDVR